MAIAIRGGTPLVVATAANPISGTLTGARQPQTGDLLVIIHGNDYYALSNMPTPTVGGSTSGVNAISGGAADSGSLFAHAKSYTYAVGSTGDLTVSVTETGAGDEEKVLVVYVLPGADTATPTDGAASSTDTSGTTTNRVCAAVSPSSADAYLIVHTNDGNGSNSVSYTPPAGMAEQYDGSLSGLMGYSGATLQLSASGSTGSKTFTTVGNASYGTLTIAVRTAAAAATVLPAPQRTVQVRDPGEAWWIQRDRRDANTVATAANPLPSPLDSAWQAGSRYWHLYGDAADASGRTWQSLQRNYTSDPGLLAPAAAAPPSSAPRAAAVRDPGEAWWLQRPGRDPAVLTAALLENELLGSADTAKRYLAPATHSPRWWMPLQPKRDATTPGLLDTALLEPPLLAAADDVRRHGTAAYYDRREVPQQRPYVSDPSVYPTTAPTDPLTVAYGAGGTYWLLYNTAAAWTDRRDSPQQRSYASDPGLLLTSLLENELLGGAAALTHLAWFTDRRQVPQQPRTTDPNQLAGPATDPLTLAAGTGGDTWRRYSTPTTHADRRETAAQPPRWTLYFDAGPDTPPLTLAWGAGGSLWHQYNPRRQGRSWPVQQALAAILAHTCTTRRPFTGTTARTALGTTARPNAGITSQPCD